MKAAQAIAGTSSAWQMANASSGRWLARAIAAPTPLPIPRPARYTARIIANVYTVVPRSSESPRVHTTSPPSAVSPEAAIAIHTRRGLRARAAGGAGDGVGSSGGAGAASVPRESSQAIARSEEHTSELQSLRHLVCRLLLE